MENKTKKKLNDKLCFSKDNPAENVDAIKAI